MVGLRDPTQQLGYDLFSFGGWQLIERSEDGLSIAAHGVRLPPRLTRVKRWSCCGRDNTKISGEPPSWQWLVRILLLACGSFILDSHIQTAQLLGDGQEVVRPYVIKAHAVGFKGREMFRNALWR